jgi:hypothetical protein
MSPEDEAETRTSDTKGETGTATLSRINAGLATLRANDTGRRVALVVAILLGIVATAIHWVGLFVAGALVGLTRRSLPRALLAGLGFGVLVLAVFFVVTPLITPGNLFVLAPLSYITVGIALLGPVWGALVRGIA